MKVKGIIHCLDNSYIVMKGKEIEAQTRVNGFDTLKDYLDDGKMS